MRPRLFRSESFVWLALEHLLQLTTFNLALTLLFLTREVLHFPYTFDPLGEHWIERAQCAACTIEGGGDATNSYLASVTVREVDYVCPSNADAMGRLCAWGHLPLGASDDVKAALICLVMYVLLYTPFFIIGALTLNLLEDYSLSTSLMRVDRDVMHHIETEHVQAGDFVRAADLVRANLDRTPHHALDFDTLSAKVADMIKLSEMYWRCRVGEG